MIELVHDIDWPASQKDESGRYLRVVCSCGWKSAARHFGDSGPWWHAWAMHLHGVITAEQFIQSRAAR